MNISKDSLYSHGVIFYISAKRFFCLYKTDKHVAYQTTGSEVFNTVGFTKANHKPAFRQLIVFCTNKRSSGGAAR